MTQSRLTRLSPESPQANRSGSVGSGRYTVDVSQQETVHFNGVDNHQENYQRIRECGENDLQSGLETGRQTEEYARILVTLLGDIAVGRYADFEVADQVVDGVQSHPAAATRRMRI